MTQLDPKSDRSEPFSLAVESTDSGRRKPRVVETGKTSQGVLFAGADCLPGQGQLFQSDGPRA